jgi:hypothetical protein
MNDYVISSPSPYSGVNFFFNLKRSDELVPARICNMQAAFSNLAGLALSLTVDRRSDGAC